MAEITQIIVAICAVITAALGVIESNKNNKVTSSKKINNGFIDNSNKSSNTTNSIDNSTNFIINSNNQYNLNIPSKEVITQTQGNDQFLHLFVSFILLLFLFIFYKDYSAYIILGIMGMNFLSIVLSYFFIKSHRVSSTDATKHFILCSFSVMLPTFLNFTKLFSFDFLECYQMFFTSSELFIENIIGNPQPFVFNITVIAGISLCIFVSTYNIIILIKSIKNPHIFAEKFSARLIVSVLAAILCSGAFYWIITTIVTFFNSLVSNL